MSEEAQKSSGDRLVLINIQGLHCHRCEQAIRRAMMRREGVHEVEVDFASGQASVLFDPKLVSTDDLVECVREAGYTPTGVAQSRADSAPTS